MNRLRQQGAALLMVPLLVLMAGSVMLQPGQRLLGQQYTRVHTRQQVLRWQQQAQDALSWGRVQRWVPDNRWQCRALVPGPGESCLLLVAPGDVLLAGRAAPTGEAAQMVFWLRGRVAQGRVLFLPRGWSDFCPLSPAQCLLP